MAAKSDFINRETLEKVWDQLAAGFQEAALQPLDVNGFRFQKLLLKRDETKCHASISLGQGLRGAPRFAAYRYRLILLPSDVFDGHTRWQITPADIGALIGWAKHAGHVITFSTLKSGASYPLSIHAQSFPEKSRDSNSRLTALRGVDGRVLVKREEMPHFKTLEIRDLTTYPLRGIRLTGADDQVASKLFELALNYDHLKAFNLVILPPAEEGGGEAAAFFFPRRRDGQAIFKFHGDRWQIAALEANGLIQAKEEEAFADIGSDTVRELFARTGLTDKEFEEFLKLLETF